MIGKARQLGFTLIELMVTVAIIAILAAMAYPSFTDMIARNRLKGAAEGLFGDLQFAKSEAIKSNETVTVTFLNIGAANWSYSITRPGSPDPLKVMKAADAQDVTLSAKTNGATLAFNPLRGTVTNSSTVTFQRTSDTAQTMSVVVSDLGGIIICTTSSVMGYKSCP